MQTDSDFLARLSADPADDATRLVYSDWLEDQDDPIATAKAEFLRVTVRLASTPQPPGKEQLQQRLQQLAADLDTDWLGVVSRLSIEICQGKQREAREPTWFFNYVCDRRWEDMQPTADSATRFCDSCKENVHYCGTITEAREHAERNHCVAVDLGVIRREGDLQPRAHFLGRPSPARMRAEEERMKLDAVSEAREKRKRPKKGNKGQ